jgi:hypothetical protein
MGPAGSSILSDPEERTARYCTAYFAEWLRLASEVLVGQRRRNRLD